LPLFQQPAAATFYRWDGDTLVLNILGRQHAKQDAIGQVIGQQLEVHVVAIPRRGGATAHMMRYLAGVFGVPLAAIHVVFGEKNVNKQIRIASPSKLVAGIVAASQHVA
jgi:uncharacterized protein